MDFDILWKVGQLVLWGIISSSIAFAGKAYASYLNQKKDREWYEELAVDLIYWVEANVEKVDMGKGDDKLIYLINLFREEFLVKYGRDMEDEEKVKIERVVERKLRTEGIVKS